MASAADTATAIAWLGGTLAVTVVVWVLVHRLLRMPTPDGGEMTYLEHAEEARRRILRAAFALVFWFTFFLTFRVATVDAASQKLPYPTPDIYGNTAAQVFAWIAKTTVPEGVVLVVTQATEAFAAQMGVALFLALYVALPALFYEAWGFFAPALRPSERRVFLAALPVSVVLFALGALFAFLYIVPLLLDVLYSFAEPLGAQQLLSAGSLVSTVAAMALLFGLAFQLPLVMAGLSALGVVHPKTFLRKWRHAVVVALVAAAFMTDPSLVTQLIVSVCLITLYMAGVAAGFLFHRKSVQAQPPSLLIAP